MIGSSPMSKRRAPGRDDSTLYPENVDTGAARAVAVCFGGCSAVRCLPAAAASGECAPCADPDASTRRAQVCLVLFYLVLSLAILPEMGGGDWQSVRCRAKEAYVAAEPSKVRCSPPLLRPAAAGERAAAERAARRCAAARAT